MLRWNRTLPCCKSASFCRLWALPQTFSTPVHISHRAPLETENGSDSPISQEVRPQRGWPQHRIALTPKPVFRERHSRAAERPLYPANLPAPQSYRSIPGRGGLRPRPWNAAQLGNGCSLHADFAPRRFENSRAKVLALATDKNGASVHCVGQIGAAPRQPPCSWGRCACR